MNKLKLIYSSSVSSIVTVFFITAVTLSAELSPALKNWLAGVTGHHWVTKGIFSLIIYLLLLALLYFSTKRVNGAMVNNLITVLIFSTLMGIVAILSFYTLHFLKVF